MLSYGAEVNCYFRVISNTVFPTALQYCLRDNVMLRLLLNSGYQAHKYVYQITYLMRVKVALAQSFSSCKMHTSKTALKGHIFYHFISVALFLVGVSNVAMVMVKKWTVHGLTSITKPIRFTANLTSSQ